MSTLGNIFDFLKDEPIAGKPLLDERMFKYCKSFEEIVNFYQHVGGLGKSYAICAALERVAHRSQHQVAA